MPDILTEPRRNTVEKTAVEPKLLNEAEAAAYIGMSRSFLRQSRMNGTSNSIPPIKFIRCGSRAIRYLRSDLDEWISQFRRVKHLAELSQ